MAELSSPHLKLASAADDIKIWEAPNFLLVHQFSPNPSPSFCSVHWSSDFQQLAIVPSSGHNVVLTLVKQTSLHNIEVTTEAATTTAKFSNTSPRFIGIGTEAGDILVWDIKYQKPKKSFMCQNGGITCLQFNWNDSYLASGTVNGNIVLHNLITGQSCSPLQVPNTQAIRGLQYSYMRRSLLGSTSDDGAVTLWDANTRQLYHNFPCSHTAPASGLSFSPVNNILLTSVGLDKRIICYDTQMKNLVQSLECETPLTSVDFMQDGLTLAVGSSRGNIFIYDLRSLNLPVQTLTAHGSSVQCLAFQNNILGSAVKKDPSRKGNSLRSDSSGLADPSKTKKSVAEGLVSVNSSSIFIQKESAHSQQTSILSSTKLGSSVSETKRSSLTADIFSPIREDILKLNQTPDLKIPAFPTKCNKTNISDCLNGKANLLSSLPDGGSQGGDLTFSPLREESLSEQSLTVKRQQPIGGGENAVSSLILGDRPITTGLAENEKQGLSVSYVMTHSSDCVDSPQRDGFIEGNSLSPKRPVLVSKRFQQSTTEFFPVNATSEQVSQNFASPSIRGNIRNPVCGFSPLHTLTSPLPSLVTEPLESARPDVMGAVDDAAKGLQANTKRNRNVVELEVTDSEKPQAMDIEVTNGPSLQTCKSSEVRNFITDLVIEEGRKDNMQTSVAPQAFQAEFVKQVVQDAMEEFRDAVHREFLNMHAQMIRHFQMQAAETQALLQQYSINDELVSEIERLKEENRHLRATF